MKRILFLLSVALLLSNPAVSRAEDLHPLIEVGISSVGTLDVINWKVGDTASFNVLAGSFGNIGTMVKSVTKDEGTAIWLLQDMNLMVQKQKAEALINKADGKLLKLIVNGQEQQIPNDPIEVISQDYADVTVPAGTFKAIHVIAKSKQASKIEVWMNPRDTVMEGTIKQIMETSMMPLTLELTSFKKMP